MQMCDNNCIKRIIASYLPHHRRRRRRLHRERIIAILKHLGDKLA